MTIALARHVFSAVAVGTIAATAFRVATAPDRFRERQETARQVCTTRGGQWVQVERQYLCSPSSAASKT
ncbi:MAG: hypothetical protein ABI574_03520 [Burkholderiales bacterium]